MRVNIYRGVPPDDLDEKVTKVKGKSTSRITNTMTTDDGKTSSFESVEELDVDLETEETKSEEELKAEADWQREKEKIRLDTLARMHADPYNTLADDEWGWYESVRGERERSESKRAVPPPMPTSKPPPLPKAEPTSETKESPESKEPEPPKTKPKPKAVLTDAEKAEIDDDILNCEFCKKREEKGLKGKKALCNRHKRMLTELTKRLPVREETIHKSHPIFRVKALDSTTYIEQMTSETKFNAGNGVKAGKIVFGAGHTHRDAFDRAEMAYGPNAGLRHMITSLASPNRDPISGMVFHPKLDIAACRAPASNLAPADTAGRDPKAGEDCLVVALIGNNGIIRPEWSSGKILGPAFLGGYEEHVQDRWEGAWTHNASTTKGWSGCGVWSPDGKLLGIHLGGEGFTGGDNFFIPWSIIKAWAAELEKLTDVPSDFL
jgi:hypothetical protein